MDPIVQAGLITGVGSALSGIFGGAGSAISGKQYLKGIRETNEMNYKIWQEQQQHNVDMFNMENRANIENWQNQFDQTNAYNTASAQMDRLRKAGLNPFLMMNGGNAGVAQSSGIAGAHATPAQAPQMQAAQQVENPLSAIGRGMIEGAVGISQAINSSVNAGSQVEKLPYETDYLHWQTKKAKEDILGGWASRQYTDAMRRLAEWELDFNEKTMKSRVALQDQILQGQLLDNIGKNLSNEAQQMINSYIPQQQQAQLALFAARTFESYASGKLSYEQLKTEITKQILNTANANLSNKQADYYGALKEETEARTENINIDTDIKELDYQKAELLANDYIDAMKAYYNFQSVSNWSGASYLSNPSANFFYNYGRFGGPKIGFSTGGNIGIGPIKLGWDGTKVSIGGNVDKHW